MNDKIEKLKEELRGACMEFSSEETVSITFFLNSTGWNTKISERSADSLKEDCVSMRNLKGDFIK